MKEHLRIAIAQINYLVGDIEGNTQKVIINTARARDELMADLIIFPELTLTGYPPEDLLFRPTLHRRVKESLLYLKKQIKGIDVLLGYPEKESDQRYNKAGLLHNGKIIKTYSKQDLPNYKVFDEKRYFHPGNTICVIDIKGVKAAITICEDLWFPNIMENSKKAGAQLMLSINASPFDIHKATLREEIMTKRCKEGNMPIVYVNCVGGQDELVFDGGSMALNAKGKVCVQAGFFKENLCLVDFIIGKQLELKSSGKILRLSEEECIYKAIVLGVRDYIEKNHFRSAIIGLSGGIDSALTLAIAVDAIGKDRVYGLLMPSRYTSVISTEDAKAQSKMMGTTYNIISIEPMFKAFLKSLQDDFKGLPPDHTEENLQARCRGILLMAESNKKGHIVLSTGNKSELSVGYSTLYGDLVGGFCVLKDVPKTLVYRLAKYRNKINPVIPKRVVERPPSAELAPGQKDQDVLPPYDILDKILERHIEWDQPTEEIIAAGFDAATVHKVITMVNKNEYKRRQAPPGVRITERAFGRDRRYPITSGFSKSQLSLKKLDESS